MNRVQRWLAGRPAYSFDTSAYGAAVTAQYAALANIGRMAEQRFEALEELDGLLVDPAGRMSLDHAVGYVQGRRGLSMAAAEALKKRYIEKTMDKFSQNG